MTEFHPAVAAWFERSFPDGPTPAQEQGWPEIAAGRNTLIAAPTGSGKTLAAFLTTIDAIYRAQLSGEEVLGRTMVVYVSPLKALAVDIEQNLRRPLQEIAEIASELGFEAPRLTCEVRTGDTPASARAAMVRRPPTFLVTTPESLYLMLTAQGSRATLGEVRWIIVDEIHALCRDKRGAHLALSLERLDHLCQASPVRIGLSATQHPIELVARMLVGAGAGRDDEAGRPRCSIVDVGHRRALELAIELPDDELGAVASKEQMEEIVAMMAQRVRSHHTTLVFVNTRRLAERVAHQLAMELGEEAVAAHHGSLSKERRQRVEGLLRSGGLKALVATASLELGIDIGPVDLVCQLSSPRSLATFLQRVGRSGHGRARTPKAFLYPTTRDELVECCALLSGTHRGRLDALLPPVAPLDVLAQQIVAECAAEAWSEEELFGMVGHAAPYHALEPGQFTEVLGLLADGIQTGRGAVGAYLHWDRLNHRVRGRRGARLAALTSGGAIPETGDYRVLAQPDDTVVGTVNEDWAVESMAGDIFLLGSTSWRITRVSDGVVRVADAEGAPPSVPFWLGEAPGRTSELSEEVSDLRTRVGELLNQGNSDEAVTFLEQSCGVSNLVATEVVRYLAAGRAALGELPSRNHLVLERFFDESGGMQVVVHSPFGARLNRALGLCLRKRFCATFDFELQAAASDDAVLLSLGPQHSFPLEQVPRFLSSSSVEDVLTKATILSPLFPVRWRQNLNRSLTVLRYKGGRKNPPPIQRMESDDVLAAVFPQLVACQNENPTGPIELPDHLLVRQAMHDCLHEAMDLDGLRELVRGLERGSITVACLDTSEPSVLAHEILNGRPYTFLDDAPLEERRSRAVFLRRGLPTDPHDLARLDPEAIARVRAEARPDPRDPDELHELLRNTILLQPDPEWGPWLEGLRSERRAVELSSPGGTVWCAAEELPRALRLLPQRIGPSAPVAAAAEPEVVAAACLRGHLDQLGPSTAAELAAITSLPPDLVRQGLLRVEAEGFALRGNFDPTLEGEQWCSRRLLMRIHAYTQQRLRREIEPASPQELMRFLLRWQRVAPGTQREGRAGVAATIGQLQGLELPVSSWEGEVLPRRVARYQSWWLDQLCLSGDVSWARLRVRPADEDGGYSPAQPSRVTPVTLSLRADLPLLLEAVRCGAVPGEPSVGPLFEVLGVLRQRGALFPAEVARLTGRLPAEVDAALWEGVSRGLVTADGFAAARQLLSSRGRRAPARHRPGRYVEGLLSQEGRWGLILADEWDQDRDGLAEAIAEQLLVRWGILFRDLMAKEQVGVPWRQLLWALRRMEARGTVRGGRFVTGFAGEQFALPEAVESLRAVRRSERRGEVIHLAACDPLNLTGIVLPGPRLPSSASTALVLCDGARLPSEDEPASWGRGGVRWGWEAGAKPG